MSPVFPPIPLHGRCEEASTLIEPVVAARFLRVTVQDNLVFSGHFNADAVVAVALAGMEVENEDKPRSLKHNDFVAFMLQGNVSLGRVEPAITLFAVVHQLVKCVEELVSKEIILGKIQLSAGVPK